MVRECFFVGIGGALGSICRYIVTLFVNPLLVGLPLGTLSVNLVGCFAIGCCYGYFERAGVLQPGLWLLATTGFLGGFTTFSAFSLESFQLIGKGEFLFATLYVSASVGLGVFCAALGMWLTA